MNNWHNHFNFQRKTIVLFGHDPESLRPSSTASMQGEHFGLLGKVLANKFKQFCCIKKKIVDHAHLTVDSGKIYGNNLVFDSL